MSADEAAKDGNLFDDVQENAGSDLSALFALEHGDDYKANVEWAQTLVRCY